MAAQQTPSTVSWPASHSLTQAGRIRSTKTTTRTLASMLFATLVPLITLLLLTSSGHPRRAPGVVLALADNIATGNAQFDMYEPLHVEPHPSSVAGASEPAQKCQSLEEKTKFCNITSYQTVQPFKNKLGHVTLDQAISELHKHAYLLHKEPCRSKIQLFLCSLYAPVCVTSTVLNDLLLPCRDDCEEAREVCGPALAMYNMEWPNEWDCRKFNYTKDDKLCVINNARDTSSMSSGRDHHLQIMTTPTSSSLTPNAAGASDEARGKQAMFGSYSQSSGAGSSGDFGSAHPNGPHENETICGEDLFDCRLRDPGRDMKALCIDKRWVCDGKPDCIIFSPNQTDLANDLDEANCPRDANTKLVACSDGQHYCDGKCLNRAYLCDGKVDCSSGSDENDCYNYYTGLAQFLTCVVALGFAIILLVKFFKPDSQKGEDVSSAENSLKEPSYHSSSEQNLEQNYVPSLQDVDIDNGRNLHVVPPQLDNGHSITRSPSLNPRSPIYNEPAYSILSRNDYERLNVGGYSGASSVYTSYGQFHHQIYQHHHMLHNQHQHPLHSQHPIYNAHSDIVDEERPSKHGPPPPVPPPTPRIASPSGSSNRMIYANMDDPHEVHLLD